MAARVRTVAFQGIDVLGVDVQVQMTGGVPAFAIVGLPDKQVAESKERVRGALTAIGLGLPGKRIIVNLAPADLAKEGTHFDLPIALALLIALGALSPDDVAQSVCLGELGLDGSIAPVAGVLPAAMFAARQGLGLICPKAQGGEAAWAGEIDVLAPDHLIQLINHCKGRQILSAPKPQLAEEDATYPDLKDIKGQESAKRALEIAAAGAHNLLLLWC